MNNYKKSLIDEHSQLVVRIAKLHEEVYGDKQIEDRVEFANCCIQLASMKKYAECLEARMTNVGIIVEDGNYFEHVAAIKPVEVEVPATTTSSPVEETNR